MMTSLDGVFAAGDIVRGASLVVWAIRDGRAVTDHMHKYPQAKVREEREERVEAQATPHPFLATSRTEFRSPECLGSAGHERHRLVQIRTVQPCTTNPHP